jgi:hypothetical protein
MKPAPAYLEPWDHPCRGCGHGLLYHPPPKGRTDPTPDGKCRAPGCPCILAEANP